MITVQEKLFSQGRSNNEQSIHSGTSTDTSTIHNREFKWEKHRSTLDLVLYWMRWTIFGRRRWEWMLKYMIHVLQRFIEQDFCSLEIYEPEQELYIILAKVSEARVRAIFYRSREKCIDLVPKIRDPNRRLNSKRISKMEE
jgi:hypothetical protein